MLTQAQARQQRRRRSPPSLQQQYHEYLMQRVEAHKNTLTREELLRLGDEAVSEMDAAREGQFTLTEVLMADQVDNLIMKRLGLRSYGRWRKQFLKLRSAQREPMHWGVDPGNPVARLLPRLEPGDTALVVGAGAEPITYLLAAHDVVVTFVAGNLGAVERVELRMATEGLGSQFQAFMVPAGGWLATYMPHPVQVVVLDASELTPLEPGARRGVVEQAQALTVPEGVHAVLPVRGLAPHAFRGWYDGWDETADRAGHGKGRRDGLMFTKPAEQTDTQ